MFAANTQLGALDHGAYKRLYRQGRMTLGVMLPIEAFVGDMPAMHHQVELAQMAEQGGIGALWFRDVPLRDPSFGDTGQVYETFVYLAHIAAHTRSIALGTAAIILPLRHPLHTAKAAASVDRLSNGRLILGIASGDRPAEFPAFGQQLERRGETFREAVRVMREAWAGNFPTIESQFGLMHDLDLVPKPTTREIPLIVTGRSQQGLEWIAANSHGWMSYPCSPHAQAAVVAQWRNTVAGVRPGQFLPFSQSLYIDLVEDPRAAPVAIHLGYRLGREALVALLSSLMAVGVNHVALNLKYGSRRADIVMSELVEHVVPVVNEASEA